MVSDNYLNSEPSCSVDSFTTLDIRFDQFIWIIREVNEGSFIYRSIMYVNWQEGEKNYIQTLSDNLGMLKSDTLYRALRLRDIVDHREKADQCKLRLPLHRHFRLGLTTSWDCLLSMMASRAIPAVLEEELSKMYRRWRAAGVLTLQCRLQKIGKVWVASRHTMFTCYDKVRCIVWVFHLTE